MLEARQDVDFALEMLLGLHVGGKAILEHFDDDVAPDLVWISRERRAQGLRADGKLHAAPELAVEVLSPGDTNERRDREFKLKLYAREGVEEYWLVDWRAQTVTLFLLGENGYDLGTTYEGSQVAKSVALPGLEFKVSELFG